MPGDRDTEESDFFVDHDHLDLSCDDGRCHVADVISRIERHERAK